MITLNKDNVLQGYSFEYILRILLRREKKNNFIFQTIRFTDLNELKFKYRLKFPDKFEDIQNELQNNWTRFDLIEFNLNNVRDRVVNNVEIYDVKTKNYNVKLRALDVCKSSHEFFVKMHHKFGIITKIIKVTLFDNWQFNYIINFYNKFDIRVYYSRKKTYNLQKN